MIPQEISETLKARFGEAILEAKLEGVLNPSIRVAPERVQDIALFLRDDDHLLFDVLMCLSGVDYTAGKLGVVYHLDSMKRSHKITLKVEVTCDNPRVASVQSVWRTANWHEREAYDLFGIVFDGHPDLRRILLPDDWEGHPLRKDYRVPEFYNGMKVPY
jgi:NADH-quinone oxidoreductase subunit C